jgi:hypothetical protein
VALFPNGLTFGPAAAKAVGALYVATASVTINSNATATLVGSGVGSLTLPAGFFVAGRAVRVRAWGYYTTTGTPSNVTFAVLLGSTTVAATNGGSSGQLNNNITAAPWSVDCDIACRSVGASGTVFAIGAVTLASASGAGFRTSNTVTSILANGSTPATATVDTTGSLAVDLQLTDAGANTTVVCTNFTLEQLN